MKYKHISPKGENVVFDPYRYQVREPASREALLPYVLTDTYHDLTVDSHGFVFHDNLMIALCKSTYMRNSIAMIHYVYCANKHIAVESFDTYSDAVYYAFRLLDQNVYDTVFIETYSRITNMPMFNRIITKNNQ